MIRPCHKCPYGKLVKWGIKRILWPTCIYPSGPWRQLTRSEWSGRGGRPVCCPLPEQMEVTT